MLQEGHFQEFLWVPSRCLGGQGADGKDSDKFHFPIYIHFPFHASSWGTRRDRALKMKPGANPVRFSMKRLQNSWKRSNSGLPCALTKVSNPGGIAGCAAGGFGLPLHSWPLQREQQIVTRAELCPQQARARPPSPATASPSMALQMASRENPVCGAHLERAVPDPCSCTPGAGWGSL